MTNLPATDVEAYLTKLRTQDEVRWLNALKEIRPEQYEIEAKRRRDNAQAAYLAECTDDKAGYGIGDVPRCSARAVARTIDSGIPWQI